MTIRASVYRLVGLDGLTHPVLDTPYDSMEAAIKAAKRLRDAGYDVKRVVSIVDRQENGEADTAMKLTGLELHSIFKLEELIDAEEES